MLAFPKRLGGMWVSPAPGTPADAQAMARIQLQQLQHMAAQGLQNANLSELNRAHLEALSAIAQQALDAKANIVSPGRS